jgi:hypothetical protein
MRCFRALLAGSLLLAGTAAQAHKSSDAYVRLSGGNGEAMLVRVDVALRDLDVALDLDTNGDGQLTWAEVRAAWPTIESYVLAHFQLDGCALAAATRSLERRIDGVYAALQWRPDCRPATAPPIRYSMLAEVDPTHRGIAHIEWAGAASLLKVLVPRMGSTREPSLPIEANSPAGAASSGVAGSQEPTPRPAATNAPASKPEVTATARSGETEFAAVAPLQFLREGMRHILTGYDHVLFLICLLLPSVMRRTAQGWRPVDRLSQAVWPVAGIVTAFTIAHTITLALAATGTVSLAPAFIEPAIAVTIILAAFDNVKHIFGDRRVFVTFAFGLIHGFGFAGVLAELNLPPSQFAWALLQFNVGLELGQLLIVAVVVTMLFALRRGAHYPGWFIRGGSVTAMVIGALWLVERVANVSLLSL